MPTLMNILQYPDPGLKKTATEITTIDDEIKQLAENMLATMYRSMGVGLAATQVNVQKRIITIDISTQKNQPLCLINPKIIKKSGKVKWEEGCLSFPGVYAKVERYKDIQVEYTDVHNKIHSIQADNLLGVCIQHEIDHLDGITFFDHLSPVKRKLLTDKLQKNRDRIL